nr:helix-turn-helix domain-containing protein [uncultured Flavobacterium sp.]
MKKAIDLIINSDYSFTEIAFLTGFSDHSHFTRIFRQHIGKNPSSFKKNLQKSNPDTKGK